MEKRDNKLLQFPEVRVVEASAGSGKTYALAKRYLQLLFREEAKPEDIRHILAITFSNQATREMKERIFDFLKKIALDKFSSPKEEKVILSDLPCDKGIARQKAYALMEHIIHNYNFFQVQTIDSFINVLLSGCASLLNLSADFKIKEDYRDLLTYSLDRCIERANHQKTTLALFNNFLIQYLYLENKTGWFAKKDIFKIIMALFSSHNIHGRRIKKFDVKNRELIIGKKKILGQLGKLKEILPEGVNKTFINSLDKFLEENIDSFDFKDLAEKRAFQKDELPMNKGYPACKSLQKKWQDIQAQIKEISEKEAFSLFNCYIDIFDLVYQDFRINAGRENIVYLEELNRLARNLFADSSLSVPELYYRLASRFRHYLIDEFQDTSQLQWENLFLMIEDALAGGGSLFYVGDKKQAIYRFRGGKVTLFDAIKNEFAKFNVQQKTLNVNYRSKREIILFNNQIFSPQNLKLFIEAQQPGEMRSPRQLIPEEINEIIGVFHDAQQLDKEEKQGGYVKVEIVDYENRQEENKKIKEKLVGLIFNLKQRYLFKDIAILCRSNLEIEIITAWLIEEKIAVESERTLNILNNPLVKELISFLKFLNSPIDDLSFSSFILGDIFSYASGQGPRQAEEFIFKKRKESPQDKTTYLYRKFREEHPEIWDNYINDFFKNVGFIPLYELVIDILHRFKIFTNFAPEQGFFMRLLELIKEQEEENASLSAFLEFLETAEEKYLYVDFSNEDAIRVMTVHKAKGLEFPVVAIPFLEFNIRALGLRKKKGRTSYVVCEEAGGLKLLRLDEKYTKFSPRLRQIYKQEYIRTFIDELDVLYVAFTRAKDEMYIFVPQETNKKDNAAQNLIPDNCLETGKPQVNRIKKDKEEIAALKIPPPEYKDWIHLLKDEFKDVAKIKNRQVILRGEVLHAILSQLANLKGKNKEAVLSQAVDRIRAKFPYFTEFPLCQKQISKLLEKDAVKQFFFIEEGIVFREKELVDSFGNTKRVDRLVITKDRVMIIDYKSSSETQNYQEQMLEYINLVNEIYPKMKVHAYLVFIEDGSVEQIQWKK